MILKVGNQKISKFNTIEISLKYDSVASTFAFSYYQDNTKPSVIEPYKRCVIEDDGETLITGTILSKTSNEAAVKTIVGISGYSTTGVLEDCQIPLEVYPLQNDGKTLKEITEAIIKPFGIGLVIDQGPNFTQIVDSANEVIETTTAEPSDTVKGYLATLASQKNIVLSHTPNGSLRFTRAFASGKSKYTFEQGQPNVSVSLVFSGQPMHSKIVAMKQADEGNSGEAEIVNPYVVGFRPRVIIQTSGTDTDTEKVVRNALSEELKNIQLVLNIGGLQDWKYSGNKLRPNTLIDVIAPDCGINKKTQFFVEEILLKETAKDGQTATLTCVVPEVHNGQKPFKRF
jgi:prophage tail gpP-like protein